MTESVLLVARDVQPTNVFSRFSEKLEQIGVVARTCTPAICAMPSAEEVAKIVHATHDRALVIGMSAPVERTAEEMAAGRAALEKGTPLYLYADTFGCWNRTPFEEFRGKAKALFVVNESERKKAEAAWGDTEVVVSGSPVWEQFFFPKRARHEVRQALGIEKDERVILVAPSKSFPEAMGAYMAAIEAVSALDIPRLRLVLSVHPSAPVDPALYADLPKYAGVPLLFVDKTKTDVSASDLITAADVVVYSPGGTTGIEAAHAPRHILAICLMSAFALNRLEEIQHTHASEPVTEKFSATAHNAHDLARAIYQCLNNTKERARLLRRQKQLFGRPVTIGTAVNIMAETILGRHSAMPELASSDS